MIVQFLLQIGECALNLVVGVGHSLAILPLVSEEIRQIEVQAVHRSSEPLVRVVHLPVLVETLVAYGVLPLLLPSLVILLEIGLISLVQPVNQCFQLSAGIHLRIQSQISPDNLFHVELAQLYVILRKRLEQILLAVYDQPTDGIASFLYPADDIFVVLHRLALHEGHVQRSACLVVQCQQNTEAASPVGNVQMHEALTGQRWLFPFTLDAVKPALDGGYTLTKSFGKLLDRLFLLLIGIPEFIFANLPFCSELVAASLAFIQLYALAHSILNCVLASAHRTFLAFEMPAKLVFIGL